MRQVEDHLPVEKQDIFKNDIRNLRLRSKE